MRKLLIILALCSPLFAQTWTGVLPSSRAIDWSQSAGLPSTITYGSGGSACDGAHANCVETNTNAWTPATRTQCGSTIAAGASVATINAAIAACLPGSYVLLGAGTFSVNANIVMRTNGVTLRGSGAQSTTLNLSGTNTLFQFGVCCSGLSTGNLSATSYASGITSVTITGVSSASELTVGNMAWFQQCDQGWSGTPCTGSYADPWPAGATPLWVCGRDYIICTQDNNPTGTHNSQQQNVLITSVTNNGGGSYTVGFTPGLHMPSWTSNQTAQLNWHQKAETSFGVGLENMTVHFTYNVNESISFSNTYGSWVTGIRLIGYPTNQGIQTATSARQLIAHNYIFAANPDNLNASIAEPMVLGAGQGSGASDTLLLNNITLNGLCYWGEGGRTGDVIAYNYCRDAQSPDYQVVSLDHGVEDDFTLHEGNGFGKIQSDNTHGTHNLLTLFRNYLTGFDPPYTTATAPVAIEIDNYQRMINIVGNAIGGAKSTVYQDTGGGGEIYLIKTTDSLTGSSLFRWGNYDSITAAARFCTDATAPCTGSEVPTSLSGNASAFQVSVPANHTLPASFFMSTTAHPSGGTGLSWWKVCTSWTVFPTSCAGSQTNPFPPVGPDVTGGNHLSGFAYDNPAAIAYNTLPVDTAYQNTYTITGSSWSGGTETLTITGLPDPEHVMGGFRLSGVNSACLPTSGVSYTGRSDNEILMTGSTSTTISYATTNPGTTCTGSMLFPDVRQFDVRVFQNDPAGATPTVSLAPTPPLDFGNQPMNVQSAAQTITLTNTGTGNLTGISVVLLSGSQFSISADTCSGGTVAPSGTCTVNVKFKPTGAAGLKQDTLSFTDNASDSPQSYAIQGTGVIQQSSGMTKVALHGTKVN